MYPRQSGILDSGFQLLDSRSFSVKLGFRIANVSGIPDSYGCISVSQGGEPGFQKQKFPGFRNPYSLTLDEIHTSNKQWNAIHLSNPTDYIRSYVMVRVTFFRQNENQMFAVISSRKSNLTKNIHRISSDSPAGITNANSWAPILFKLHE